MMVADGSHQTAAQRGGEAKDKDKPLPDLQRDRCASCSGSLSGSDYQRLIHHVFLATLTVFCLQVRAVEVLLGYQRL